MILIVHRTAVSSLIFLLGCSPAATPPPDDAGGYQYGGGTYALAACGYSVTTPDQSEPPAPGSATLGSDPTPWARHLGIAGDPATSIVVSWRTKDDTTLATTVQFGEGGKTDQSADGLTFSYVVPSARPVRIHETHICGLKPGTVYTYRVGGKDKGGTESWSDTSTFHTAPAPGTGSVTALVIGDTRGGYVKWGQMLGQAQAAGAPDIVLFSGDGVELGPSQSEWDDWFTQAEPVLKQVALLAAHGNHDINAVNYYDQFALPGNEAYYGLTYGPFHLTVLNDTPPSPTAIATTEAQFLQADLTAADAASPPWKFLMHHKPMYSSATAHGSDMALRTAWGPIVDAHKVDMVFNGHDHDYERTKPMRNQQPGATNADGTVYVVAGSAGADLYGNGMSPFTAFSRSTYNFALLKIRAGNIDMKAYDDMGNVIDTTTLTK